MSDSKEGGHSHGFSGLMEGLKDKLSDTKLHDAKIQLIHKKSVLSMLLLAALIAPQS